MDNLIYEFPIGKRYKPLWLTVNAAAAYVMSNAEDWDMTLLALEYKYRFHGQTDPVFLYQFAQQHGAQAPKKYPIGNRYIIFARKLCPCRAEMNGFSRISSFNS